MLAPDFAVLRSLWHAAKETVSASTISGLANGICFRMGKNSRASQECKQVFDKQNSKHIETCQRHGRHFGGHTKKEPPLSEMKLSDHKLVANYREIVLAAFQNVEDELAAWCGSLVDR